VQREQDTSDIRHDTQGHIDLFQVGEATAYLYRQPNPTEANDSSPEPLYRSLLYPLISQPVKDSAHPFVLMHALGMETIRPFHVGFPLFDGDLVFIGSSGVSIPADLVIRILQSRGTVQRKPSKLRQAYD